MAMIGKVLRMHHREKKSVREIVRATSLSRNTVRKYLRTPVAEPLRYRRKAATTKLSAFVETVKMAFLGGCTSPEEGAANRQGAAPSDFPGGVRRRLHPADGFHGQALVQRHPSGYRLTAFGERLLPLAQEVERAMLALTQNIDTFQRDVSGVVRVTCPEPLMYRITNSTLLDRFRTRYPGLQVEFVMTDKYLDFAKGEVDIALRSGDTQDNALVGRKVGDSLWAVYASPKYIARHGLQRAWTILRDTTGWVLTNRCPITVLRNGCNRWPPPHMWRRATTVCSG